MLTSAVQRGMTLVETMISVTIGVVLLLGLTTFMAASLGSNVNATKLANLNQELRAIMTLMTRDIRRAGYWGSPAPYPTGAITGVGFGSAYVNPFATINTATAGCILYAYDKNNNATLDTDEKYGFLLSAGAVMMRTGSGATWDCTTAAGNSLDNLSDAKNTNVTALTFTETDSAAAYVTGSAGPNIKTRQITITITAQLVSDATVRQTLTETVKLENDLFSPT